jgi:ADP-ribose pyrophosphatase YjhB (NUDIX family)
LAILFEPSWLDWAKRLQAIAQAGLTYTEGAYDRERYRALSEIAVEIMANHSDIDVERIRDLFANETGYTTPKVDVRGVAFNDAGEVLLVRETSDGGWTLPGGWADVQTSPAENVTKEVEEESGFRTRAVKLLAVYDRSRHPHVPPFPHHVYKLFFLCEIIGGEPRGSIETSEVGFFGEDDLPELSVSRVLPAQVTRFFEHRRNPHWPTDFD